MALEVILRRSEQDAWGFRLIGGLEFNAPLTVVKVTPLSPAMSAGLRVGDKLLSIGDRSAITMTHEEAQEEIRKHKVELAMQIIRGLYDPILDDQEGILEEIDPLDDFDQPFEPTEVPLPPLDIPELPVLPAVEIDRSNTASPFVVPTKPYRPFSTDPIPEIPPLEDPIILNPNYHDEFGQPNDDFYPKSKFKLPVSKQYDPNYGKPGAKKISSSMAAVEMSAQEIAYAKQAAKDIDISQMEETVSTQITESSNFQESCSLETYIQKLEASSHTKHIEEKQSYTEKVDFKSDVNTTNESNIVETAQNLVDDSIFKAVTVAEEIKKEMLQESCESNVTSSAELFNHESKNYKSSSLLKQNVVSEEIRNKTSELDKSITKTEDTNLSIRQEIHDTIAAGTVKRLSETFDNDTEEKIQSETKTSTTKCDDKSLKKVEIKTQNLENKIHKSENKDQKKTTSVSTTETRNKSTAKLLAEQRAYIIGLQTIPNIKGKVHSSYHYNLLLKTFFIHLTDVMVALSRFILNEPVLSKEGSPETEFRSSEKVSQEKNEFTSQKEVVIEENTTNLTQETDISTQENDQQDTFEDKQITSTKDFAKTTAKDKSYVEKHKLSGSEIAQVFGHKSEEMTHKMDAVITEFQTKTGIEENIHEEISIAEKSEEPTICEQLNIKKDEMVDIQLKTNYESEMKRCVTEMSSSLEKRDFTQKSEINVHGDKSHKKEGKMMYVATVESHTYPSKDAILEEHLSGASSVQSLEENKNVTDFTESSKEIVESIKKDDVILAENLNTISSAKVIAKTENVDRVSTTVLDNQIEEKIDLQCSQTVQKEQIVNETEKKVEEIKESRIEHQSHHEEKQISETKQTSTEIYSISENLIKSCQKSVEMDTIIENQELTNQQTEQKVERPSKLSLKTDKMIINDNSYPSSISTPTPMTVPPTPLTDEYIFRILTPLPKNVGHMSPDTPPPEKEIDHEDLDIVKRKLIPHIDTTIERLVYDPPLASPTKTDLITDVDNGVIAELPSKEEILEIERKSSLLASAIDETIKSIEEYKEQVGIDTKKETFKSEIIENNNYKKSVEPDAQIYQSYVEPPRTTVYNEVKPRAVIPVENETTNLSLMYENTKNVSETISKQEVIKSEIRATEFNSFVQPDVINVKKEYDFQCQADNDRSKTDVNAATRIEKTEVFDSTVQNISNMTKVEEKITMQQNNIESDVINGVSGFRPVNFDPNEFAKIDLAPEIPAVNGFQPVRLNDLIREPSMPRPINIDGEVLGTQQGIVGSLEDTVMDDATAKALGKPGMSEQKIAELISGQSEMLREAHVMGLSRVLSSHMTRVDDNDSSVDFKKIKPTIDKLRDSEVIKALNEELSTKKVEKKQDDRKWTTFLQKPERPAPKVKFGYHGWLPQFDVNSKEAYKVKIVKQPKPKVAPDYEPKDFETGPLPWEERAANEPPQPPIEPEDPILIPEEAPQFFEAVDPLPESEVPDLEDTGIPLPPEKTEEENTQEEQKEQTEVAEEQERREEELNIEAVVEETQEILEEMEGERLAQQMITNMQSIDPTASLDQQLLQIREHLAALAQLPGVIQQSLELVTKQLSNLSQQETTKTVTETVETVETTEVIEKKTEISEELVEQSTHTEEKMTEKMEEVTTNNEPTEHQETNVNQEQTLNENVQQNVENEMNEMAKMNREKAEILDEQRRIEKQKKVLMDQMQIELQSRQLKQRGGPRVGKPTPAFGPLTPQERPLVLPGGRKWRKPKDAYNDQFFTETLAAQAEIIQGTTKGINFMKYEKPPVSLDHLKDSDVYKLIHNMEDSPLRRVDMLTPVIAECDYREAVRRSMTPCPERMNQMQ